jgi:hypothetical protein
MAKLADFLAYYEAAHRNAANRCVHHFAHALAAVGILLIWKPLIGVPLIATSFALSWAGHFILEGNKPAFFDSAVEHGVGASLMKKVEVALGGLAWSGTCFLRLFGLGPLK